MGERRRNLIQLAAALAQNGYIKGFFTGTIYQGPLKSVCVPGLNCYSCPGALGSCPLGALQSALGGGRRGPLHYVLGLLILFGALFGRLICGFLCPFGFVQDLLDKLKTRKLRLPERLDGALRYVKYAVLLITVVLLPLLGSGNVGGGDPFFCKYICPAGTLGGGLPLVLGSPAMREAAGFLFSWKLLVLAAVLILSVFICRPFCKYLCPLGAFYGLMNKLALYRMSVDENKCVSCGKCEKACPMQVPILKSINSPECIRCGKCKSVCPTSAISSGMRARDEITSSS